MDLGDHACEPGVGDGPSRRVVAFAILEVDTHSTRHETVTGISVRASSVTTGNTILGGRSLGKRLRPCVIPRVPAALAAKPDQCAAFGAGQALSGTVVDVGARLIQFSQAGFGDAQAPDDLADRAVTRTRPIRSLVRATHADVLEACRLLPDASIPCHGQCPEDLGNLTVVRSRSVVTATDRPGFFNPVAPV